MWTPAINCWSIGRSIFILGGAVVHVKFYMPRTCLFKRSKVKGEKVKILYTWKFAGDNGTSAGYKKPACDFLSVPVITVIHNSNMVSMNHDTIKQ